MDINPYESPKSESALRTVKSRSTFVGVTGSFTVETPNPHEIEIYMSRWTGLEIYRVDGIERLRVRSFHFKATRQFEIQNTERHVLEILVKSLPWWTATVTLDGVCVVENLFPSERKIEVIGWTIAGVLWLLAAIGAGVLILTHYYDRWQAGPGRW
jgi:hypothetical protein